MDKVRRVNTGRTAAIAILAAAMLAAGCASQGDVDYPNVRRDYCPRNMTLQCFKRTAEPKRCTCVTPLELEELLEDVIGN
jgi:hypothetical protein